MDVLRCLCGGRRHLLTFLQLAPGCYLYLEPVGLAVLAPITATSST